MQTQTLAETGSNGRQPTTDAGKMVEITLTLSEVDVALLDHLSPFIRDEQGRRTRSRSEGVRWALRALHQANNALLAEARLGDAAIVADPSLVVTEEELERDIAIKVAAMQRAGDAIHVAN